MALAQTQALLARLFTDAAFREHFFQAPVDIAIRRGLSEAEARVFASIDPGEVEAFARSLIKKRAQDLKKAMPLTALALGERFDAILMGAILATADDGPRSDAAALVNRIDALCANTDCPDFVLDVARFEFAFVESAKPGFRLRRFRYDISAIAAALSTGAAIKPRPCAMLGVWVRLRGRRLLCRLVRLPRL